MNSKKGSKIDAVQRPSVNEVLLETINHCGTWLEAKELARLTGISIAKCKIALPQLVEANQIGVKYQATLRSGDEVFLRQILSC